MGVEGWVMGSSGRRGHDAFGSQNSKASRGRGLSAPRKGSVSLSLSFLICRVRIIVPSIPSLM